MTHGAEQSFVVAPYMLDDPMMWIGLSAPIEDEGCECEGTCRCSL